MAVVTGTGRELDGLQSLSSRAECQSLESQRATCGHYGRWTARSFADEKTPSLRFTLLWAIREGYAPPEQVLAAIDEDRGPRVIFDDPGATIALANMFGSGISDIVHIRNHDIYYWPILAGITGVPAC
jgi:hypothetical protein